VPVIGVDHAGIAQRVGLTPREFRRLGVADREDVVERQARAHALSTASAPRLFQRIRRFLTGAPVATASRSAKLRNAGEKYARHFGCELVSGVVPFGSGVAPGPVAAPPDGAGVVGFDGGGGEPAPVVDGAGADPVVGAAPVVGAETGAVATGPVPAPFQPQPAHHHTPMPIATSTMMPMTQAPELSSPMRRRRLLSGS
jgi:hypothetical protein